jgi:hypothetical protein
VLAVLLALAPGWCLGGQCDVPAGPSVAVSVGAERSGLLARVRDRERRGVLARVRDRRGERRGLFGRRRRERVGDEQRLDRPVMVAPVAPSA